MIDRLKGTMLWLLTVSLIASHSLPAAASSRGTLVFVASPVDNWELFVLRAGATVPEQLTTTPLDERAPALSPDGKRVAYATSDGSLWVMSLDGGAATRLDLQPGSYGYPAWLPDASGIVYTSYEYTPGGEDADLFLFRFATAATGLFVLQTGPQDYAAVSPDGGRVAYVTSVATTIPGFGSTVTQQLWLASLRTGAAFPLFRGTARETRPAWSKNGRTIAFSSDRSGTPEIWVSDSEGKAATRLTTGPGAKSNPAWSPDGTEIAYVVSTADHSGLQVIDVRTKKMRTMMLFGSRTVDVRDPDWR